MRTLVLMIAPPGAGKSTLARKLASSRAFSNLSIIVSSDAIRKRLFGDEAYQGGNRQVFETAREDVEEALAMFEDVCVFVDACNCTADDRRAFTAIAIANPDDVRIVAVLFDGTIDECLERNASRERVVPEDVIFRFHGLIPTRASYLLTENPEFDCVIPFSIAERMV